MGKDLRFMLFLSWMVSVCTAYAAGSVHHQSIWFSVIPVLYMHWLPVRAATKHMEWVADSWSKDRKELVKLRSKLKECELGHENATQG